MTDTTAAAGHRRVGGPRTAARFRARCPNPYRVPRPAVISFSGGRTSGFLLKHVVDAYDGRLPASISVVFANTGLERPETLDFVDRCAVAWSVPVHWVQYDWDAPHRTRVVDHATGVPQRRALRRADRPQGDSSRTPHCAHVPRF